MNPLPRNSSFGPEWKGGSVLNQNPAPWGEGRKIRRRIRSNLRPFPPSILLLTAPAGALATSPNQGLSSEIARLAPYHASLAVLAFLLLVWGMTVARRKGPGWLKKHRILGISGAALAVSAMAVAAYMVSAASQEHLRVPHAYLGSFIVLLLIVNPLLGFIQLRVGTDLGRRMRRVHRFLGRAALLLMALNILFGMIIVGSA
ncbi:Membrane protein, putative [Methanothrix harundinacea 6Ac]|uniref:Membrane protein, putative n=1 Tax=Methanothrix harundinacea (strain 6Ac) TaxID=1110509 RepID=G7WPF3_METH6|nr:Membrane protein, putative [Methanothrix harundinacea 6Ac]